MMWDVHCGQTKISNFVCGMTRWLSEGGESFIDQARPHTVVQNNNACQVSNKPNITFYDQRMVVKCQRGSDARERDAE